VIAMLNPETKKVISWGSIITALVSGMSYFFKFPFELSNFTSALTLWVISVALLIEIYYDDIRRNFKFQIDTASEIVSTTMSVIGILAGIMVFKGVEMPPTMQGIVGFLYIILALILIAEMYSKD